MSITVLIFKVGFSLKLKVFIVNGYRNLNSVLIPFVKLHNHVFSK